MKRFKDNKGDEWAVDMRVDALARVKDATGLDLLDLQQAVTRLNDDVYLLADVAYMACRPECETRGLSREQFYARLSGESLAAASAAVVESVIDFFPPARRGVMRRAVEKMAAVEAEVTARTIERLDALDVQRLVQGALGNSSTSAPGSAASTPPA
jgi:hypothetical protein